MKTKTAKPKNKAKDDLASLYYNNTNAAAAKKLSISVSTLNKRVKAAKIQLKFV